MKSDNFSTIFHVPAGRDPAGRLPTIRGQVLNFAWIFDRLTRANNSMNDKSSKRNVYSTFLVFLLAWPFSLENQLLTNINNLFVRNL